MHLVVLPGPHSSNVNDILPTNNGFDKNGDTRDRFSVNVEIKRQ